MQEEDQKIIDEIKQSDDFFQKAKLIQFLQKEKKLTTKALSDALRIKPSYFCHIARLNKLPEMVIDGYYSQLISISHLFIIARLKELDHMRAVYEKTLAQNLTVLQTEELVREYLYHLKAGGDHIEKDRLEHLVRGVEQKQKGVSVKVLQTRIKAKVVLEIKGNLQKTSQALITILEDLSK
jgi:hypothetical protein